MENTLLRIWQHHYNSDFAAGVQLLARHGPEMVTKNILTRLRVVAFSGQEPNAYEVGKLEYALSKISAVEAPIDPPEGSPPQSPLRGEVRGKPGIQTNKPKASDALPPAGGAGGGKLSGETDSAITSPRAKELHKAHAHHHALMVTADTDAERAEHAGKIIEEIVPALDAEYDRLKAGGKEEAEQPELAVAPITNKTEADKLRRLQSVRTRIGQLKKKLANPKDLKQKQKYETELAEKEAERDRLQQELS